MAKRSTQDKPKHDAPAPKPQDTPKPEAPKPPAQDAKPVTNEFGANASISAGTNTYRGKGELPLNAVLGVGSKGTKEGTVRDNIRKLVAANATVTVLDVKVAGAALAGVGRKAVDLVGKCKTMLLHDQIRIVGYAKPKADEKKPDASQ